MGFYTIRQGDYLSKIASKRGFRDWRTIYDHPENAAFRALRPDPNIVCPGDRLFVPDREVKQVPCAAGARHRFKVRRDTSSLHVVLKDSQGEPIQGEDYTLTVGDQVIAGTTGGDGAIHHENLPPNIDAATLWIRGISLALKVGHLDPLGSADDDGVSGVQGRLQNLGYYLGPAHGALDDNTREAVRRFRQHHGLGDEDAITLAVKNKLRELHGC